MEALVYILAEFLVSALLPLLVLALELLVGIFELLAPPIGRFLRALAERRRRRSGRSLPKGRSGLGAAGVCAVGSSSADWA